MAVRGTGPDESLELKIKGLAEQVAASMSMEVVLAEVKGEGSRSVVRVFIDQPTGITLEDCERYSKRFSVALDVEDWIPSKYTLEVSSPGVDRPLVREADFARFQGENARVRTRIPIEGQKNFKGKIVIAGGGGVTLEVAPGRHVEIAITDIDKARLIADLSKKPQGS
ncbi:MAG: ribosome maturation factor RimP [Acidobacteriota bacterium]|jgi:ribosome maturation factor RimP|nr:ribosome maturation factor RimP [Acidobacteriota bacterium]NLT33673.1 ribosome maturation factor RimP [Acidobacteriota bacterium]